MIIIAFNNFEFISEINKYMQVLMKIYYLIIYDYYYLLEYIFILNFLSWI
jgi:hypothetical protein